MKKLMLILTTMLAGTHAMAETYETLWKQASVLQEKDLPRSEIEVMRRIITKATDAKDYGQLLAAEMRRTALWGDISPDSIMPAFRRMERKAERATDPVLKAVWYASLGKLCQQCPIDLETESAVAFFKKALAQPELLARQQTEDYTPLTMEGMDGSSFGHDLLHLIGFEANTRDAYRLMHDYYQATGNRGAACLCAFKVTQLDRQEDVREVKKSKYLQTIDSLLKVYQDVPEAGEVAVERYRFMEGATDANELHKVNFINYALNHWGRWSRMNVLRNAKARLTEPMFQTESMPLVLRPGQKLWVVVKERNLQGLTMTLSRLDITADNHYDVRDKATYKMLKGKTTALHQYDRKKRFFGRPAYEVVRDSFELAGLTPGAYMMEIVADDETMAPDRRLFYVSDLALMTQQLPDDSRRYVVVSATTGQPIAGAQLLFYEEKGNGKSRTVHARLTTDSKGEAIYKGDNHNILISTSKDKYTPARYTYASRHRYYEQTNDQRKTCLYTDRSIYRPGQVVHVSSVSFYHIKGVDAKVLGDKAEVKYTLRDANGKVVGEKTATMDEYGTASVEFELPLGGKTGRYSLSTNNGGYRSIRVEEYKRPTFEVTFPKVNQRYVWGDTVVVRATAKTYAGFPVQGAKVDYQVTRRSQLWWWGNRSADQKVMSGSATTAEDGTFLVEIPLEAEGQNMSDFLRKARFYHFEVEATVTDVSGESHVGEMTLPLGTKPTAFGVNLKPRMEVDSLGQVTFSYLNSNGVEIAGDVNYRIGKGEWKRVPANAPTDIKEYPMEWKSGVYQLEAICGQDSLRQQFTLFGMGDNRPVEHCTEWHYQTASQFTDDGKPVCLQVGSSENGVHIVYSLISGNKLLEKGSWEIGDSIVTLPFVYKPEYGAGVVLDYSFVKNGVCYSNTMSISRPLPQKQLNISWQTFRNRLVPGQKEEWTLRITTPDGKPAKAQLMSVLYDKSLDQMESNDWRLSLDLYQSLPLCPWRNNLGGMMFSLNAVAPVKYYPERELDVDGFAYNFFPGFRRRQAGYVLSRSGGVKNRVVMEKHSLVLAENRVASVEMAKDAVALGSVTAEEKSLNQVQLREDLAETAFFYPALESDDNGNVAVKFTLPESVTTWKFVGLAHDKEMRHGTMVDEAVAQKVVMAQPNLPRFLREGDKAQMAVKLFSSSDKKVSGSARMQFVDPETNKVVWQKVQKFEIEPHGTAVLTFDVQGLKEGIYINKVVAAGNGYSDGEQHYLPVLSNRETVINTLPITLHEKGTKNFDLSSLFAGKEKEACQEKVTVEYTNQPAWLMMQALPSISKPSGDNAISLMSAIYANGIARWLKAQYQKNDSVPQVEETQLMATLVAKLRTLQNADGSFSWWKGMEGSRYMTTAVAMMMARQNKMAGEQKETASMLTSALDFLQKKTADEVRRMKEEERKARAKNDDRWMAGILPSETALDYLYILSLDGRQLAGTAKADVDYLIGKMARSTNRLTIYGKAQAAVVLARAGYRKQASDYLRSIEEYSVYKEEMGRYFDTRKAYYSWRDYKIPTQVAAIEAIQLLSPERNSWIEEMQRWLLMSKRTQAWDTPINTVNAVYAFLHGNGEALAQTAGNATIKLDGKPLPLPQAKGEQGCVSLEKDGEARLLTIEKKNEGTSWGAVYAQFSQPSSMVASSASGIKITRKVERTGDKVKVTLLMEADRDYDFVEVIDKRAACLEPVNQKSGCQMGEYYIFPRDNTTNYYFNRLNKGRHIVSTEYYVDRQGDYHSGTCTAQCTYSPEFGGHTDAYTLNIK